MHIHTLKHTHTHTHTLLPYIHSLALTLPNMKKYTIWKLTGLKFTAVQLHWESLEKSFMHLWFVKMIYLSYFPNRALILFIWFRRRSVIVIFWIIETGCKFSFFSSSSFLTGVFVGYGTKFIYIFVVRVSISYFIFLTINVFREDAKRPWWGSL